VDDGPVQGAPRRVLAIRNRRGLHARAAAKFVKCAQAFEAKIAVTKDGTTVSGLSIMGLMMLAAAIGSEIEVSAEGKDAEAALEALARLVEGRFDEQD
jgi:phosphocarrier protein